MAHNIYIKKFFVLFKAVQFDGTNTLMETAIFFY